jgi:hypothetical protein
MAQLINNSCIVPLLVRDYTHTKKTTNRRKTMATVENRKDPSGPKWLRSTKPWAVVRDGHVVEWFHTKRDAKEFIKLTEKQ